MRGLISSRMASSAGLVAECATDDIDSPAVAAKAAAQRRVVGILANVPAHPMVHVCAVYL
jgi:hypothetical protein